MRNTKRYIMLMLVLLFAGISFVFAHGASGTSLSVSGISVCIDEVLQEYEIQPVNVDGTVYVPMRAVFEAFGASVQWNGEERSVLAEKEDSSIYFQIGAPYASQNGMLVYLEQPPFLEGGTTMVPLRMVGESLGYEVEWDNKTKTVFINTKQEETGQEEGAGKKILTYEQAINQGVRNNSSFLSAQRALSRIEDTNENYYVSSHTYIAKEVLAKKELNTQEKWAQINLELIPQVVGNEIKNQMDDITLTRKEAETAREKVALSEENLRLETLKYKAGLTSKATYESAVLEKEQSESTHQSLEKTLEGKLLSLSSALGEDVSQYETFEYKSSIEEVTEEELEEKIKEALADDPYVWYAQQTVELKEYGLLTYDYNINYNMGGESYTSVKLDLSEAKTNAEKMAEDLETVIEKRYNQLQQLTVSYEGMQIGLKSLVQQLETAEKQYDAGLITAYPIKELKQTIRETILEMEKLQVQYGQMKVLFEIPYLYPEYASAG